MDCNWQAWQFNGHPVALASPVSLDDLKQAEALLDGLQCLLNLPIASIVNPPRTILTYRRGQLIEIPNPSSPRANAENHSEWLSAHVTDVRISDTGLSLNAYQCSIPWLLRKAKLCANGCWVASFGWGEPPRDLMIKTLSLPNDFGNRLSLAYHRLTRMKKAIRRKQQRLRGALRVVETYAPGQVFVCHHPLMRYLAAESPPLVVKAHRDATGAAWTII